MLLSKLQSLSCKLAQVLSAEQQAAAAESNGSLIAIRLSVLKPLGGLPVSFGLNRACPLMKLSETIWLGIAMQLEQSSIGNRRRALLSLALTSREVRKRLLSMPTLWATIWVTSGTTTSLSVARSSALPLSLYCWFRSTQADAERVTTAVHDHVARAEMMDLYIEGEEHWQQLCEVLRRPAPGLRWMAIRNERNSDRKSSKQPVIPKDLLSGLPSELNTLVIRQAQLPEGVELVSLRNLTHFQYTRFGIFTPKQIVWLLGQLPALRAFGLDSETWSGFIIEDGDEQADVFEPSPVLRHVAVHYVTRAALAPVLQFFSRVPHLSVRPRDQSFDETALDFLLPLWSDGVVRMNQRWRRAVTEYHGAATESSGPRQLRLYIRRLQTVQMLSNPPAVARLTRLSLDEAAWSYLAEQLDKEKSAITEAESAESTQAEDRPKLRFPLRLENLVTLVVTLSPCAVETYTFTLKRFKAWGGLWTRSDFFDVLYLPGLEELHLAHLVAWTCRRVVSSGSSVSDSPCRCANNGLLPMQQVVEFMRHRRVSDGDSSQPPPPPPPRLPRLIVSGVSAILDDSPAETKKELEQYVEEFVLLPAVPQEIIDEDAEVELCNGRVLYTVKPPVMEETDSRYKVSRV